MQKIQNASRKQLFATMSEAKKRLDKLTLKQRAALEKGWDIEHAYYSSALEGSKLDRKHFEELGEKVA